MTTLTYTPAKISSEVKLLLILSHLLEGVLAVVRFGNSALKNPFVKGIPFILQPSNYLILSPALCWGFSGRAL
jgi:hypothetical protein